MLTSTFVPGVSELFHYVGTQLAASSPPTDTPPPAWSWLYGQCRRWANDSDFLYAESTAQPIQWLSIASHTPRVGRDGNFERPRRLRG